MRRLIAFALVLAACRGGERSAPPSSRPPSAPVAPRGPDPLLLRVPMRGGIPRVVAYPDVDSTVWTGAEAAPALDRVLAFDADAGLIAAADARGFPVWIDLRVGSVTVPNRGKLRGLASVDGSTIYGIGADGAVARFTPSGNSVYKPPLAARAVFPQLGGTILVLGGRGDGTRVWRVHPPQTTVMDSLPMPNASSGASSPLGDRIYFEAGGRTLTGLQARTFAKGGRLGFEHAIVAVASTPSGDRSYVLMDSSNVVIVVDGFQDRISGRIDLPGRPRALRVDPFGRYVLVRPTTGDSAWVIGIGTNRLVGVVRTGWRGDLPLVTADGAIAVVSGADVAFVNSESLKELRRVAGGAADFWYPFVWSGLRPRSAALDAPPPPRADTDTAVAARPAPDTVATARPAPSPDSAKAGFTVSFAALLNETKARELAVRITVNGQTARVVTGLSGGTAIYRVVLGPYATREDADAAGRAAGVAYYVYAGAP